ncbi:Signal transduction histidine kinase [Dyadobacter soli]|uniref:Signal transduction histidine kinase n=1 Tax=Dyadobacter soli TaxID=659014 RepID=A0A1G7FUP0_9BACT|nr:HAMP domain-containing sensor histidine kinase [Dyadobacter soli]SDE79587.1 Signal transduction histidine kinase [Dyadobacter soli]
MIYRLSLLFLLLFSVPIFAQNGFSVRHFTADNGLPQNSIKSISADTKGYIWLATEDGLVRFDGFNFVVFSKSDLGISSSRFYSLEPGQRRKPGVTSTRNDGRTDICYATNVANEAVVIRDGRPRRDTAYTSNVLAVRKRLSRRPKDIFAVAGLPDIWNVPLSNVRAMIPTGDGDGNFYLCDNDTVSCYKQWRRVYDLRAETDDLWHYFALGGRLYHLDAGNAFTAIFNGRRSQFQLKGDFAAEPHGAGSDRHRDTRLYWNPNADQAFLFRSGHLYLLEPQKDGTLTSRLLTKGFDLTANSIDVVHYDPLAGLVHLGSSTNGLFVLTLHQFETVRVSGNDRPNIFYAQIPFGSNSVLTPTGIIAGKDNSGKPIDKRLPLLEKVNPSDKRVIFRDRQGNLWTKNMRILIKMDANGKHLIGGRKLGREVKAILQVNDSTMCLGMYERGLFTMHIDGPDKKPRHVDGVYNKNVTCLDLQAENQVLVGTEDGLYHADLHTGKISLIQGTRGIYIKSIHSFGNGRAWITAAEKGLLLLDGPRGLVTFPHDKQGYLASAHCVVDDGRGFLWVSTNRGLFRISRTDLLAFAGSRPDTPPEQPGEETAQLAPPLFYEYHAMNEGFNTNEFNGNCAPCALKFDDGTISLPSLEGLVWFRPSHIRTYLPGEPLMLDRVDVNRQIISDPGDTVSLPLSPENVRLHFSTPYFGHYDNLNVSYTLIRDASDLPGASWIPLDDEDDLTVQYSNLPSGTHMLVIRKQAGFGLNNYTIKKIWLTVPRHWFETAWAKAAFAALLILTFVAGVRLYNHKKLKIIQKEKLMLEEMVRQRTSSLETALAQLEESKRDVDEQVHLMSRMLASISHDVQSPLNHITFAAGDIAEMVHTGPNGKIIEIANAIAIVSSRTGKLLHGLLNYIKIQVYGKRMHSGRIELNKLILEKLDFFESVIQHNGNRVTRDIPQNFQVESDYELLAVVIHNLLDNAAKYTRNGEIALRSGMRDGVAELIISNSGPPLSQEKMDFINQAGGESTDSRPFPNERVVNLGLIIIKEVSQLLGISISVRQTATIDFHILFKKPA